jgi:solute carrier family 25 (peroxisomal adenine nucleotide transporter), member 17
VPSTKDLKGKTRGDINPSVFSLLVRIYYEEGIAGYYRGFGASMLNTFSMRSSSLSFISSDCN